MRYFVRRIFETIGIMAVTSLPMFIVLSAFPTAPSNFQLVALVLFIGLYFAGTVIALRTHLIYCDSTVSYACANVIIFALKLAFCVWTKLVPEYELFEICFKPMEMLENLGIPAIIVIVVCFVVELGLIAYFPIDRKIIEKEMQERGLE